MAATRWRSVPTGERSALGAIRTRDLPLRRRLLYPSELRGRGDVLMLTAGSPRTPAVAGEPCAGKSRGRAWTSNRLLLRRRPVSWCIGAAVTVAAVAVAGAWRQRRPAQDRVLLPSGSSRVRRATPINGSGRRAGHEKRYRGARRRPTVKGLTAPRALELWPHDREASTWLTRTAATERPASRKRTRRQRRWHPPASSRRSRPASSTREGGRPGDRSAARPLITGGRRTTETVADHDPQVPPHCGRCPRRLRPLGTGELRCARSMIDYKL